MKDELLSLYRERFQKETGTKFNLTAHKKLWNWLSENPTKRKEDCPIWQKNGGELKVDSRDCFACDYASEFHGFLLKNNLVPMPVTTSCCEYCPLQNHNKVGSHCLDGIYTNWLFRRHIRAYYAKKIADFPVREGVECE